MSIGQKLLILRSQTKYSRQDIADKLGINQKTYANWESEKTEPSASYIPELAKVFDVTIDELFEEETETAESAVSERK